MDDLRDKVVFGIKCKRHPQMTCHKCPYFLKEEMLCNVMALFDDALALLNAQPMLITLEEGKNGGK